MANNLAKIRGKHQLTQTELANALGVTKQGVCFNETGKLSVGLAKKAAAYLNEDVFELLGTDVLVLVPETDAQKEYLINLIKNL
jgi:DNA-binding XRE family transcriptional regulator